MNKINFLNLIKKIDSECFIDILFKYLNIDNNTINILKKIEKKEIFLIDENNFIKLKFLLKKNKIFNKDLNEIKKNIYEIKKENHILQKDIEIIIKKTWKEIKFILIENIDYFIEKQIPFQINEDINISNVRKLLKILEYIKSLIKNQKFLKEEIIDENNNNIDFFKSNKNNLVVKKGKKLFFNNKILKIEFDKILYLNKNKIYFINQGNIYCFDIKINKSKKILLPFENCNKNKINGKFIYSENKIYNFVEDKLFEFEIGSVNFFYNNYFCLLTKNSLKIYNDDLFLIKEIKIKEPNNNSKYAYIKNIVFEINEKYIKTLNKENNIKIDFEQKKIIISDNKIFLINKYNVLVVEVFKNIIYNQYSIDFNMSELRLKAYDSDIYSYFGKIIKYSTINKNTEEKIENLSNVEPKDILKLINQRQIYYIKNIEKNKIKFHLDDDLFEIIKKNFEFYSFNEKELFIVIQEIKNIYIEKIEKIMKIIRYNSSVEIKKNEVIEIKKLLKSKIISETNLKKIDYFLKKYKNVSNQKKENFKEGYCDICGKKLNMIEMILNKYRCSIHY